jgi:hypothetical protein
MKPEPAALDRVTEPIAELRMSAAAVQQSLELCVDLPFANLNNDVEQDYSPTVLPRT